jgi:hypothetical protein
MNRLSFSKNGGETLLKGWLEDLEPGLAAGAPPKSRRSGP